MALLHYSRKSYFQQCTFYCFGCATILYLNLHYTKQSNLLSEAKTTNLLSSQCDFLIKVPIYAIFNVHIIKILTFYILELLTL